MFTATLVVRTANTENGGLMFRRPTYRPNGALPDGQTTEAQSAGEARDLVPTSLREERDSERLAVPCFVIFAPRASRQIPERSVSNEGGLIRFGFDSPDEHARKLDDSGGPTARVRQA
jgi:hypothetical protein